MKKLPAKTILLFIFICTLSCFPSHAQRKYNCGGQPKVTICRVVNCPTKKCPDRTCLQHVKVCPDDIWPGWSLGPCTAHDCSTKNDSTGSSPSDAAVLVYPAPDLKTANILFSLPRPEKVTVKIYDQNGKWINTLSRNRVTDAGLGEVVWNTSSQKTGIYCIKVTAGDFTEMKKFTLLK